MKAYTLPIDCPRCGNDLTHLTSSAFAGTETVAVARCEACRTDWAVHVQLRRVEQPEAVLRRRYRQRDKERVA